MRERMGIHEIILPDTTPALEWVNGRALQKVSPQQRHGVAQASFASALLAWAREYKTGRVATEWECRIAPTGQIRRPLVPDVAFLSYARVPREQMATTDIPRIAPDAVVEVISPGDRRRDIEEKIRVYLACGTNVVFLVDTKERTVTVRDGNPPRVFSESDVVRHESLTGFAMPVLALFEDP